MISYYLYRLKWWFVDKTGYIPKSPINVDIELAGKCNLACTMCNYGLGTFDESKQGMMPTDMAYRAVTEAKQIGAKSIKLNFRGEPGLHKELVNLIRYAKELGFVDVFINTNLLAFSKQRLEELALSGIDKIIVSIDGVEKQTYEKIRVGGNFEKLMENIRYLNRWLKVTENKTKLILQMVCDEPDERLKEIEADGYRYVKTQDRSGHADNKRARRRCPQPRQRIIVAWDGTLFGCCSSWNNEFPLGNYNDISLLEAWNGPRIKTLRKASTKCDSLHCKKCQVAVSYK